MNKKKGILIGVIVLVVAAIIVTAGIFMSKEKPEAQDTEIDESKNAKIEYKVEYGEKIKDEKLSINTNDGEKEVKIIDLDPKVDTMKIGKTEHKVKIDESTYDVFVMVEDTQKPKFKGIKEKIKLKGEKVDVEKELKKLITAKDPVDGEVKVNFEIKKDKDKKDKYDVIATAKDKNDNTSTEKFEVVVEKVAKKDEPKKDKNDVANKDSNDKSSNKSNANKNSESNKNSNASKNSNVNSNKNTNATENKPKPKTESKPKTETKPKPKPENKPKPKPENKPKPKPENKPKPKPENKPKPKPETKPNIKGPSGSTFISEDNHGYLAFSYNDSSLPGGGKIIEVGYKPEYKQVMISGLDKAGKHFAYSSGPVFPAELSNDALTKLQNVENIFMNALN